MQNYVEREGEILPAYNGVNQPIYSNRDTEMPHEFPAEITEDADSTDTLPYIPPEHRNWRENLPTKEQKSFAKIGLIVAREALDNIRDNQGRE